MLQQISYEGYTTIDNRGIPYVNSFPIMMQRLYAPLIQTYKNGDHFEQPITDSLMKQSSPKLVLYLSLKNNHYLCLSGSMDRLTVHFDRSTLALANEVLFTLT